MLVRQLLLQEIIGFACRERTNYSYCNRGILTIGFKNETVEIVGIIFPRPQPPKPMVLEIIFCCQNFINTTVVHNTTSN